MNKIRFNPKLNKHVWIVNHHASIPSKDDAIGRHLHLSKHLSAYGWTSSLIISSTKHPSGEQTMKKFRLKKITNEIGIPVLWVRSNSYKNNTVLRFIGMLLFSFNLLLPLTTKGLQRPSVIIGSTVHPFAAWTALLLAKRYKVPFIYEIRDIWPETLIDLGVISEDGAIAKYMKKLSIYLAEQATLVIAPLQRVDKYLSENGIDHTKFRWISNGTEISEMNYPSQDKVRINEGIFTFMYLGSHGKSNALEGIIEAFDLLCKNYPETPYRLRFVGEGSLKNELFLKSRALSSASSIIFENQIPQEEVLSKANEADCLVINIPDNPVYKYGISPNKLFTYMASGKPILMACNVPNNPIFESDSGMIAPVDDVRALSDAMYEMSQLSAAQRISAGKRGFDYLIENFAYEKLATKLAGALDLAYASNITQK